MILSGKGEDAKPKFLEQVLTILRARAMAGNEVGVMELLSVLQPA